MPVGVRRVLRRAGHEVVTSPDLTADQNIAYQQNLEGRKIALLVLGSNDWSIVRQHMDTITAKVEESKA